MPSTDIVSFSKHLMLWLSPEAIVQSAHRLIDEPEDAFASSLLLVGSPPLSYDKDGGLRNLLEGFLGQFQVPHEVISFLRQRHGVKVLNRAWEALSSLRFNGEMLRPLPEHSLPFGQPVVVLRDADVVIDLITQPVRALQGMVSTIASSWMQFSNAGIGLENFFLRHGSSNAIEVWLEAEVASACGFLNLLRNNGDEPVNSLHLRYRAMTVIGWNDPDPSRREGLKDLARSLAASTLDPIY